jgi:exodeoxyribonuclease VII large subunit
VVLTVKQLSSELKTIISNVYTSVEIVGEVYTYQQAKSGHKYLSLKEDDAILDAVCWKHTSTRDEITLGQTMVFRGNITTYQGRSKYQLVVHDAQIEAAGTLQQQFEKLKAQLQSEGLFDESRKQPIPEMPSRIGIITSETGAVIEDMRLQFTRCIPAQITLYPASVQGESAVDEIIDALSRCQDKVDVIIIARGGGSEEDLLAFNTERLIREVAACRTPIVSAIGHETDTTLCDYVADLRASTPTAAPTLILPLRAEMHTLLRSRIDGANRATSEFLRKQHQWLQHIIALCKNTTTIYDAHRQSMDYVERNAYQRTMQFIKTTLPAIPIPQIDRGWILDMRTRIASKDVLRGFREQLAQYHQIIEATSVQKTLQRGFCIVRSTNGHKATGAQCISGESVQLMFCDKEVEATIA